MHLFNENWSHFQILRIFSHVMHFLGKQNRNLTRAAADLSQYVCNNNNHTVRVPTTSCHFVS